MTATQTTTTDNALISYQHWGETLNNSTLAYLEFRQVIMVDTKVE